MPPLRPAPELHFPRPAHRRWLWPALGLSLALHAAIIAVWLRTRPPSQPAAAGQLIVLLPRAAYRPVTLPNYAPSRAFRPPARVRVPPSRRAAAPKPTPRVAAPVAAASDTLPAGGGGEGGRGDTLAGLAAGTGTLRPSLADSVLWVRPLPVTPSELREVLADSDAAKVDSAVTVILQAYLDSLAREPEARGMKLPSWVAKVGGKKFGVDQNYVYIAGIKIPAVVLALLPLPQGNIDQARAYNHLMDMRADLERAAQRAATMDEFKEQIREIRERKEQERAFLKAQRTRPDIPPDSGGKR